MRTFPSKMILTVPVLDTKKTETTIWKHQRGGMNSDG